MSLGQKTLLKKEACMGILSVFSLSGGKGGEGILHIKCIKAKEKDAKKGEFDPP